MIFAIVIAVILIPIVLGLLFAAGSSRFDNAVAEAKEDVGKQGRNINPELTLGHEIEPNAGSVEQVKQARLIAAKKAAAMPRGANFGVGHLGESKLKTAWQGVENDPITAAKIAEHHGWQGVKTGVVEGEPMVVVTGTSVVIPTKPAELVPGKDYPFIEITDDMEPAEKRKARIANAKAKSAARKAAKQSAGSAAPVAASVAAAQPAAVPAAPAVAVDPPTLIEITDDMAPDDKRKARIANSKAKSAYNKALKAAGVDPKAVAASQAAPPPPPAPAAAAPAPEISANVPPKPELIALTDDMSPDEKRKARISNSKAKSAYNKALKAAGIDPKTVSW